MYNTKRAGLIKHDKITDELGNTVEMKIWKVPISEKMPHGLRYSLVYIVNSQRVIGYDNYEQKSDHRHYLGVEQPYVFQGLDKLAQDFYTDVSKYKESNK